MISIGRYRFEGPVYNKEALKDAPGVYAVLDDRGPGGTFVLDIGEAQLVRCRVRAHDRENCWLRNRRGMVCYAALYFPGSTQADRCIIERELRERYAPACGVR